MMIQILSFLISIFLLPISSLSTTHSHNQQTILNCLKTNSLPTHPISSSTYFPTNSSYSSTLQKYIRNLRFNETTTPKPVFILTAAHESHIQAAIICAKSYDLTMKIRSGGHDYEGISYWSNSTFFILDLFNLRSINVNIEEETAWVQVGATLGEVYYRIAEKSKVHGYPAGVCPTVGVGGHVSGGGYGNMMRKYGLTVDNVVDAKIIDVNGRILDRESMGEDLFWAITGGGASSFGVALSYKIKLVRVPEVVTVFNVRRTFAQNATDLVYKWQRIADKLDDDLFVRMIIDVVNDTSTGRKTIRTSFFSLFLGDTTRLLSITNKTFPELGLKKSDCTEMSWVESVLYYTGFPNGTSVDVLLSRTPQVLTHLKRKSDYLKQPMTREGIEFIFNRMIELERPVLTFNPYGGRMAEIASSEKPFPHRAGNIAKIQYATNWNEDGSEAARNYLNLTAVLYDYMTPFVSKSPREAFLNYRDLDIGINHNGKMSFIEGARFGVKYFKRNYKRLVHVKSRVDPHNFFRNEQSIPVLANKKN
ncbi:berberine bridge enzyme-like 8 [Impatiens glandulifera]|uniref:berberine bridge enzyme-like 8 n=1 Tax=Impatiens glandulifera TaxID=253017 RepID=UPI001FB0B38A|nr:berberine bridge enzyme-like 8 [Impatiens glandulifera]